MEIRLVADELARAYLAECDARAVVGVDVGCYLEYEACELRLVRADLTFLSLCRTRRRCYLHKAVEQFLHAEIVERRAEEDGGNLCRTVGLYVKLGIYARNKFKVVTQSCGICLAHPFFQLRAVDIDSDFLRHPLFVRREEIQLIFVDIIYAFESDALIDGP